MPSILTQEEVDALLSAVAAGEVSAVFGGDGLHPRRVEPYDFERPAGGGLPVALDYVHDLFAESASASLTGLLSLPVVLARSAVSRIAPAQYHPLAPQPSMFYRVRLAADGPEAILQLGSGTILAMIERLFGGAVVSPVRERPLTLIETSVLQRIVQKLLIDLSRAWARYGRLEPEIAAVESQSELLRLDAAAGEPLVVVTLEVRLAETAGFVSVAYPESFVAGTLGDRPEGPEAARPETGPSPEQALSVRLLPARVAVSVELGRTRLTLRELKELKVGDVIRLETPVEGELVARVAGRPKLAVRPGRKGRRLAVSVVGPAGDAATA